ncbi:MAG: hypothetical protein WDZ80_08040 [Candidatus Paceibacterota bacterium]
MVHHDGKVLSFKIGAQILELYRIKTIRKHKIFIDNNGHYYASWNDFWHVFNNLSSSGEKHWSIYEPIFIHDDHCRFFLKKLSKFRASLAPEKWDIYLKSWNKWEEVLIRDVDSLEIDLSDLDGKSIPKYIGFYFDRFHTITELISYLEASFLKQIPEPTYNGNWFLTNNYTGQKVVKKDVSLLEGNVIPGSILKLNIASFSKK